MTTKNTTPRDKAGDDTKAQTSGAAPTTADGAAALTGQTGVKTPDTGTQSTTAEAKKAPAGSLSRNDATRVMTAIDELRKRTVKEIRTLTASANRKQDTIKEIELSQKTRYLDDLADLHRVVGEAFDLGGY